MTDFLYAVWNNQTVRYLAATVLGFVLAVVAQQVGVSIQKRRVRAVIREGLVEELAKNLSVLDNHLDRLRTNLTEHKSIWLLSTLDTAILQRCLDPSTNIVLTDLERVQSIAAYRHCEAMNGVLDTYHRELRADPSMGLILSRKVVDRDLPVVGQICVDLLCTVLIEQQEFASTHASEMANRLLPLFEAGVLTPYRVWRTASVPQSRWKGPFFVAWHHDAPASVPEGVQVIQLAAPLDIHEIVDQRAYAWGFNWRRELFRRIARRRLKRSVARIRARGLEPPFDSLPLSETGRGSHDEMTS